MIMDFTNDDTENFNCVPSDMPIPKIEPTDPLGGYNMTDAAYAFGPGDEILHADGSVTTRPKVDGSGGGNGRGGADGGGA